jgi:photosystem II stability/assembly factor-like uncharacterized protein
MSEAGSPRWTRLGTGGGAAIINRGSTIVYDPDNPDTFWESGIYAGGGLYRTDDGGLTFQQLGAVTHADAVSVDFADPARRTLLTSIHEQPTVFRSVDGGRTWSDVSGGLPRNIGQATGPYVIDADVHLVGTRAGEAAGIFRTYDGGGTWTRVHDGAVVGQPLLAKSDGALYWVQESGGVIRSDDRGVSWRQVAPSGILSNLAAGLTELPDGRLIAAGRSFVMLSEDHGANWRGVGAELPYEPNGFAYSPFREAFYIWRFSCGSGDNSVAADAIMTLRLELPEGPD